MLPTEILADVIRMIPFKSLPALSTVSSKFNKIICSCFSKEDRVFASLYSQMNNGVDPFRVVKVLCKHNHGRLSDLMHWFVLFT
uniref:F-box domain-containing protein n=1 Tax=Ditylenchus dipsaci TaxID=166011 RepID=A0A915CK74_9BILA